jgi:DNA-binding response OmpR family regulator
MHGTFPRTVLRQSRHERQSGASIGGRGHRPEVARWADPLILASVRRQYRVLLVDDDALLITALARAAAEAGLSTSIALDAPQALELCKSERPDLVLLDINMPSGDGRDILKTLKQNPDTAKIPVAIHSARSSHHDRILTLELGAEDYFEKPFDLTLLFRRVISTIEKAGQ